ncbi:3-hydroxyacyl-CoA dehydrogenase NAD-binding domain-containing protein [Steroidobacter sp.]|uniref:3-hydroxyacyl-CoA dehydrogenase NAD-binding domain-containing protein n=1 Tax=Steroidobacter sp. TaxID=1978227 RepID=UPI001A406266|nr:3-hydroxyacyl-CoA dehydrogenase NAD-binding domain-containing protein [Steroidobacter sp.]MBL8269144.1 enoyl-CoA hydratase/isomerase family protein [Steroidobacter sp.]
MSSSNVVRVERDGELALVIVHNPPVNTINAEVRAGLQQVLQTLQQAQGVRGVLLLCEGSTFFSGADIGEFSGPPKEEEYRHLFNGYEALNVPVVAAMHGTVMGGGLEIALACHYRVAAAGTRFGMPEVTLGIIPGAGGTQRMPRLIGADQALELIVTARPIDAAKGRELGFVDEIIEGDLRAGAANYLRSLIAAGKGPRRTGELTVAAATATPEVFERQRQQACKLYPNRTAAQVAVEVVQAATQLPFQQGLEYETKRVNECKQSVESKGSVHVFFAERETRRIPGLAESVKARPIKSAGVIGAGTMGGGIAICFANAGMKVTLIDANEQGLTKGLANVDKTYQSMVSRGRLSEADKAKRMALISTSLTYDALSDADVIIEAVFESMDLKRKIFAELDRVAKPGAVLATNTSTLDIEQIADATKRPQDVIGMHFFSPANVMPLLEVVRTTKTSDETIRTVMDLAKPLRKTPVLAKVCYGFIGNRMMEGYAREAEAMVLEGATPRQIDSALEEWGMAMGILAVFDMAGIDVGVNVHKANASQFPPDPAYYQADFALHDAGRLGQKNGKGYYRYEPGNRARFDDPEAIKILQERAQQLKVPQRQHTKEEILERCLYPLLSEGLRILGEGVALRASDIDVVWAAGYGFARYRGGPMFYAETIGLKTLLAGMRKYQDIFGPMHWQPAPLLVELVERGLSIGQWEAQQHANQTGAAR